MLPAITAFVLLGNALTAPTAFAQTSTPALRFGGVDVAPEHYLVTDPLPCGERFVLYAVGKDGQRTVLATDVVKADDDHGVLQSWRVTPEMRDLSFVAVSRSGAHEFFNPFDPGHADSSAALAPASPTGGGTTGVLALSFTASQLTLSSPSPARKRKAVISGVSPTSGGVGTIVTITGAGFPSDPLDVCTLVFDASGQLAGMLETQTSSSTQITARVSGVNPASTVGRISIAVGAGGHVPPTAAPLAFEPPGAWLWFPTSSTEPAVASSTFNLAPGGPGALHACPSAWGSVNPATGFIEVHLSSTQNYPAGSRMYIQVDARATPTSSPAFWFDKYGILLAQTELGPMAGALQLCARIQQVFFQQTGLILSIFPAQTATDIVISILPPSGEQWIYGSMVVNTCMW